MTANWKKPHAGGRGVSRVHCNRIEYGKPTTSGRLPERWRDRLPDPAHYYAQHVAKLSRPNANGWAQGVCPFHDDHNASLSVQVAGERGHFKCFACGERGDMVTFHRNRTGLGFVPAVRDLLGLRA